MKAPPRCRQARRIRPSPAADRLPPRDRTWSPGCVAIPATRPHRAGEIREPGHLEGEARRLEGCREPSPHPSRDVPVRQSRGWPADPLRRFQPGRANAPSHARGRGAPPQAYEWYLTSRPRSKKSIVAGSQPWLRSRLRHPRTSRWRCRADQRIIANRLGRRKGVAIEVPANRAGRIRRPPVSESWHRTADSLTRNPSARNLRCWLHLQGKFLDRRRIRQFSGSASLAGSTV